jgi:hypothetical protein
MFWTATQDAMQVLLPQVDRIVEADREYAVHRLCRDLAMTKALLPPLTTEEATLLVEGFVDIGIDPDADRIAIADFPRMMSKYFSCIPDVNDSEVNQDVQEKSEGMSMIQLARKMKALDPLQVVLIFGAVEFYWAWRKNLPQRKVRLADFFNIKESSKA